MKPDEPQAVAERYARRPVADPRYSLLQPDVWHSVQERQRALIQGLARRLQQGAAAPHEARLLEVGCGHGHNLLDALRMGFAPEHLTGLELLPERFEAARQRLPGELTLLQGDATQAPIAAASQDLVLQATVFSSLLNAEFQQRMAQAMWAWLKPGGAVVWYDFVYNNPRNPDVRGVPVRRIRELFPHGALRWQRLTLAPPLARPLGRLHPSLLPVFNTMPWLRTHVLAWIEKPAAGHHAP